MTREERILRKLTEEDGGLFYDTALRAMREFVKKDPLPPADDKFVHGAMSEMLGDILKRRPAEGEEEILAKGRVLMYGNIIVDPIMLPEGIYATKELRIYLPETTIEHLLETGKSFRDKTQTRWLPDSYFDNLSKCELIDVDVVRDATLHAQKIADKMVSERLREELIAYDKWLAKTKWGIGILSPEKAADEYLKSREK